MKINHVERVRVETRDREFYDNLLDRAAGSQEAEDVFGVVTEKLVALGVEERVACELVLDYGRALQENGFNAGFDLGFSDGALLAAYGEKKA